MTAFLDNDAAGFLAQAVDHLKNNPVQLTDENDDGRINSANNEGKIIECLRGDFIERQPEGFSKIHIPKIRSWYDFSAVKENASPKQEIFVNIKISDLDRGNPDNCSSKLGMGYALCGIPDMPITRHKFHEMLARELKTGFDYYFLIINKTNTKDCFWTSLKRINTLESNGNNLPFQCKWAKNRAFSDRTEIEAIRYILRIYLESRDKKETGYPFALKEMLQNNQI